MRVLIAGAGPAGASLAVQLAEAGWSVTLADALLYACEQKPDAVVDLATLTGACVIALGDEMAGLWSNNDLSLIHI